MFWLTLCAPDFMWIGYRCGCFALTAGQEPSGYPNPLLPVLLVKALCQSKVFPQIKFKPYPLPPSPF